MKNIKTIHHFLPEPEFIGESVTQLIPEYSAVNEALGDGINLDGKLLSEVKVSDWLWDFDVERKSFPRKSVFYDILEPGEDLSVFTAQLVNTFVVQAWKAIKTKKFYNLVIPDDHKKKIRSKLKGFWGTKGKLDTYAVEKQSLSEFIVEFERFIVNGGFGESIQLDSDSIVLSKTGDPTSGSISKIVTTLKSFFSKSSWQRSLAWLINNIANNAQHVKWLNTTVYETNTISSGISPDLKSVFDSFIIDAELDADMPIMTEAMPAIKIALSDVVEASKRMPKQGADTWMGALYNTYLFGLYQRMLIIGCCAWVYDVIGDTDMMSDNEIIQTPSVSGMTSAESTRDYGLTPEEYNGIAVYRISYLAPEFKNILDSLLQSGEIGKTKYDGYINMIQAKKDSRRVIRDVRGHVLAWGNRNGFSRTDGPDVRGLYTDGSTRIIIPISMFKKLVG